MPIQQWSDHILLLDMRDEPQFSEDLQQVSEQLEQQEFDIVVNLAGVHQLNSTSLGELLKLRQHVVKAGRDIRLCSVPDAIWGLLLVTAVDKVFKFAPDVPSALASLQLDSAESPSGEEE